MSTTKRAGLWAMAALLTVPLTTLAQTDVFRPGTVPTNPRPNYNPGYQPTVVAPGYAPTAYYGAGYGNSYGAALQGQASLAYAQGQYLNDWQSARMSNQSVEQEKLKTRKMAMDLKAYEQSLIVPLEDQREKERMEQLRRAMGDPPVTEIYAAISLNDILKDCQDMQIRNIFGPPVAIDQEILDHINIAAPTGGNVGVFRNGAKPKWPLALLGADFAKQRMDIEDAMAALIKQGEGSTGIEPTTVKQYLDAVSALDAQMDAVGRSMSLSNIMAAKRQITELNDAGTALQSPDVGNLFSKKWKVQGKTIGDVVKYMSKEGLKFGPATSGDQAAYRSFHYSLVSYNLGARQVALSTKPPPPK